MPDSSFFTITKIEYDYGKSIELPKAVKPNYLVGEKMAKDGLSLENKDEIKNVIDHAIKNRRYKCIEIHSTTLLLQFTLSPLGKKLSLNPFPGHSYRGASYSEYKNFLKSSKTGVFGQAIRLQRLLVQLQNAYCWWAKNMSLMTK